MNARLIAVLYLLLMLPMGQVCFGADVKDPQAARTDSLLSVYDTFVARSDDYVRMRQTTIDSITEMPMTPLSLLQVAELYVPYQSDSALHYYNCAIANARDDLRVLAAIRRIRLLASIGNYDAAFREKEQLGEVPEPYKVTYYDAMYRLCNEASMSAKLHPYADNCWADAQKYADSIVLYCEANGLHPLEYFRQKITRANARRDYLSALAYTDSALLRLTPEQHDYAIFAFERGIIYREMGDVQTYYQWLLRSAITDVRCGVTDNGSSWMIAMEVYNKGDLERAYRYINYSINNANTFNATTRYQQVAPVALIISRTHEAEQDRFNYRLWATVIGLIVIIMGIISAVVVAHRRNKELHAMNHRLRSLNNELQESNMVKEQYICRYLEVYSNMIDRMARMARKTEKDPDAFLRKEMMVFYRDFDQTFLTLYPTFVNDFNALLRPEARILPKQGDMLTTELRIFALIRLGIDTSAKIAQLLCYAPNTIYNYRAQIRNAALVGKEEFERQVRLIGRRGI